MSIEFLSFDKHYQWGESARGAIEHFSGSFAALRLEACLRLSPRRAEKPEKRTLAPVDCRIIRLIRGDLLV